MKASPRFPVKQTKVVSRIPELLRLCSGKKVLHLGCADMPYTVARGEDLLHHKLAKVTNPDMLWGIDTSAEGIHILQEWGFGHLFCADVEEMSSELRDEAFDIILAGEIIEHLANPGRFLQSLVSIMGSSTELILTTPNATSFKGFLTSLLRQEKVHPDHNYYFSYRTLKQLTAKFGLECREIYYYQEIEGHGLSKALDIALALSTRISPLCSDGLIVRAISELCSSKNCAEDFVSVPTDRKD